MDKVADHNHVLLSVSAPDVCQQHQTRRIVSFRIFNEDAKVKFASFLEQRVQVWFDVIKTLPANDAFVYFHDKFSQAFEHYFPSS